MSTKHVRTAVAAPTLGAMLLLLLLASGEAHASSNRDAQAARGTLTSGHAGGLVGSRVADARGRGRRATFQTHC